MITDEQSARIQAALTLDDYQALTDEVTDARREARSARLDASTEKARADQNHDTITRLNEAGKENARLAQIGRTVALRFSNPSITYGQERDARRTLIDAHLGGAA